jgi:hypothetical protein
LRASHPGQFQQRSLSTRERCSASIIDAEGRRPNDGRISSGAGRIALIAFAAAIRVIMALFALGRPTATGADVRP